MVTNLTVPAKAHLVLLKVTRSRTKVLVKVSGIEIQTVDLTFGIFAVWAADLPQ